jgi:hypothetical protein
MFMLGIALWFLLIYIGYACRGPNYAWYWPWESWFDPKPADPSTWNVFGPEGTKAMMPLLVGIPVVGAAFGAAMFLPKLIQKELDGVKTQLAFNGLLLGLGVLGLLLGKMSAMQIVWLVFFGGMTFYFGFVMPQRHIRALDWPRYLVTMALVVSTMGVLLKMAARLAFGVKYVITIPAVSMNI